MRFAEKVVLVTGARMGVGFATATRLVNEGACPALVGHDHADPHAKAATLDTCGPGRASGAYSTATRRVNAPPPCDERQAPSPGGWAPR